MTRPLLIAASFVLVCLPAHSAFAQAPPASTAPAAAPSAAAQPAAQPAAPAQPKGEAARGKSLVYTCLGCHGITGYRNAYPNYPVPLIAGQSPEYLFNALNDYRKGTRKHPTMQAQAQSFSEQDIADIAAYLSGFKP